ncbi:MAG: MFS transporter [Salinarimonadaceae bacterium]|nr:MAG: MFS transporter [Salinarimonadaceae bacterium]
MTVGPRFRLSFLNAAIFAVIGLYMPFFPIWLESRGLAPATIGWILAAPIVARVVVTAPLLGLTERGLDPRLLLALAQGALVALFLIILGMQGAIAIGLVVVLIAIAQAPLVPTADLLANEAVRADGRLSYGGIRIWGSLGFLACSLGGGALLSGAPVDAAVIAMAALAAVGALASLALPPMRRQVAEAAPAPAAAPRALLWLIAAGAAIQASHGALYAFGSIAWRGQGFSEAAIGVFWALGVVAEILLFWLVGRFASGEARAVMLIVAGAAGAAIRFAALAFAPGLAATLLIQALHGLSFGATHLGMMAALAALAPPGGRGKAQGVFAASTALAMALATVASGRIYPEAGPLVFLAMTPLALAGALCALRARSLMGRPG